jgi:transposase
MRTIQRRVSKKQKGSTNQVEGKRHIARHHSRIADKRRDFHFKLANLLCKHYDVMVFEDLNIAAMKKLWGRKVSDLGFAQFMEIMKFVAFKRGKKLIQIDRFEATTSKCSACSEKQKLGLEERTFSCKHCGLVLGRDHNAAINILEAGHRLVLSQSTEDHSRKSRKAVGAKGRRPAFRSGEYVTGMIFFFKPHVSNFKLNGIMKTDLFNHPSQIGIFQWPLQTRSSVKD